MYVHGEVQLTGSDVPDTQRVPIKRPGKIVTLVNAVAITDTVNHDYNLIVISGLSEVEILSYQNFKISAYSTHNQTGTLTIYSNVAAVGISAAGILYTEATNLASGTGTVVAQGKAGGVGANASIKAIPSLEGIHSNFMIRVVFAVAPTTGSITIKIEMS